MCIAICICLVIFSRKYIVIPIAYTILLDSLVACFNGSSDESGRSGTAIDQFRRLKINSMADAFCYRIGNTRALCTVGQCLLFTYICTGTVVILSTLFLLLLLLLCVLLRAHVGTEN